MNETLPTTPREIGETDPTPEPTEAHVIVRYDPDQTAECRITGEHGTTIVTFGPNPPRGHEHGETMLMHILRVRVAPIDDA